MFVHPFSAYTIPWLGHLSDAVHDMVPRQTVHLLLLRVESSAWVTSFDFWLGNSRLNSTGSPSLMTNGFGGTHPFMKARAFLSGAQIFLGECSFHVVAAEFDDHTIYVY